MKKRKNNTPRKFKQILNTYITELNLPWRILNVLKDSGCLIIGDIVQKTEKEFLVDGLFDKRSLRELKKALEELDLNLGMEVNNYLELSDREKTVREALGKSIDKLHLSNVVKQRLKKWGLRSACGFVQIDKDFIENHEGLGRKAIKEIEKAVGKLNLHFGSKLYLGIDIYMYLKELHEKEQRSAFSKKSLDMLNLPEDIIISFENDGVITINDLMKKINEVFGVEKLNVQQETIDTLKREHIKTVYELRNMILKAYEHLVYGER